MFGLISAIVFGAKTIKEACEPTLPAGYHANWKLEQEDANKVRFGEMTQREFERNMRNGKYRAVPNNRENLEELEEHLRMRWTGNWMNECDYGKYNFIKTITKEEAKKRWHEVMEKILSKNNK